MTTEQEAIQTRIDEVQANVAATEAAAAEYAIVAPPFTSLVNSVVPWFLTCDCSRSLWWRRRYEANINNNMAYYQRLRDLSKEYNKAADEFRYAVEDLADDLAEPVSTASIQQLGTLVDQFNSEVKPQVDNLTEKYNSIDTIATELTVGCTDSEDQCARLVERCLTCFPLWCNYRRPAWKMLSLATHCSPCTTSTWTCTATWAVGRSS